MPVCARCIGIYGGAFLSAVMSLVRPRAGAGGSHAILPILAILPVAIDGATQALGMRESTNLLRVATGAFAGVLLTWWIVQKSAMKSK